MWDLNRTMVSIGDPYLQKGFIMKGGLQVIRSETDKRSLGVR